MNPHKGLISQHAVGIKNQHEAVTCLVPGSSCISHKISLAAVTADPVGKDPLVFETSRRGSEVKQHLGTGGLPDSHEFKERYVAAVFLCSAGNRQDDRQDTDSNVLHRITSRVEHKPRL